MLPKHVRIPQSSMSDCGMCSDIEYSLELLYLKEAIYSELNAEHLENFAVESQ